MKFSEGFGKTVAQLVVGELLQGDQSHIIWEEIESNINAEIERSRVYLSFKDGKPFVEFWFGDDCAYQAYAPIELDPFGPMSRADDDDPSERMVNDFRTEADNLARFIGVLRARKIEAEAAAKMVETRLRQTQADE